MISKFRCFIVLTLLLTCLLFSVTSCSDEMIVLESGEKICFESEYTKLVKKTENTLGLISFALIEIHEIEFASSDKRMLPIELEGASPNIVKFSDFYESVLRYIELHRNEVRFDEYYNAYRLDIDSEQAGEHFYLLKPDFDVPKYPLSIHNISDVYLSLCVDGFGDEGRCFINQLSDRLAVKYSLGVEVMPDWKNILSTINSRLEKLPCDFTTKQKERDQVSQ